MIVVDLKENNIHKYIDELIRIDNQLVDMHGIKYSLERWDANNFLLNLLGKWDYSFVALGENYEVVGCIIASQDIDHSVHINRLFVDNKYVCMGVGSLLLRYLEIRVRKNRLSTISLFVNINNIHGINFYVKNGFIRLEGDKLKSKLKQTNRNICQETFIKNRAQNKTLYMYEKFLR